jgi:branched-chain amino acid transport system ATP-binding protein
MNVTLNDEPSARSPQRIARSGLAALQSPQRRVHDCPAIEVASLSVSFGGLNAIDDLSVDIPQGEVAAVVGPNGSGKTTLLNALSKINRNGRTTGEIRLLGQSTRNRRPAEISSMGVGRSFQDPHLLNRATVIENVLLGAHSQLPYTIGGQVLAPVRVARIERAWRQRALSLLEFAGIARYAYDTAGNLSYGIRKLIDISRALLPGPQIVLLDEPASGLDRHERTTLASLLRTLRESDDITIVMIEHDLDLVKGVATSIVAMHSGRLLVTGDTKTVMSSPAFREALLAKTT